MACTAQVRRINGSVGNSFDRLGEKNLIDAVSPAEGALRAAFWGGGAEQMAKYRSRLEAKGIWRGDGPGPRFGDVEAVR